MNVTTFILWTGRFLFLGLLYLFMFHLYRALLTSAVPTRSSIGDSRLQAATLMLVSFASDGGVWVEEAKEKERRLEQGGAVNFADRLEVGRAPGNGVRVVDPYVSARHFVIERRGAHFVLQDLSTTNGTTVDGKPVQGNCLLQPGAVIQIGTTRFRFETR